MPTNSKREEDLAELSYLWTSGEWKLGRAQHSFVRVVVLFEEGRASPRELIAVRSLVPRFAEAPIGLTRSEVGEGSEFVLGVYVPDRAVKLEARARARGMQTRTEEVVELGYVPINIQGMALLLDEDDELARLVVEEMLRQGVPVVNADELSGQQADQPT